MLEVGEIQGHSIVNFKVRKPCLIILALLPFRIGLLYFT